MGRIIGVDRVEDVGLTHRLTLIGGEFLLCHLHRAGKNLKHVIPVIPRSTPSPRASEKKKHTTLEECHHRTRQ